MENTVVERIRKAKLTKSQLKIAEYVISNPELAGRSSSLEVARAVGVSDVSVTRFARAIGYPGFTELKNDIYDHLAQQASQSFGGMTLNERLEANSRRFGGSVTREEFAKIQTYNLERTLLQNAQENYDAFVRALHEAKECYVAGFRGCKSPAQRFAWLLNILTLRAFLVDDEGVGGIDQILRAGKDDCVVFFSVSRYFKSDLRLARLAREHDAKICLITDSVLSPLVPFADVILTVEVRQMSIFNSMTAMNAVSEYLLTLLTRLQLDRYRAYAHERDEYTKDLLA